MAEPTPPQTQKDKAAESAALSNLSDPAPLTDGTPDTNKDAAALGAAVSNLSVSDSAQQGKAQQDTGEPGKKDEGEGAVRKRVKISAEDVAFLVEELEVGKGRAGELLRECGGERERAVRIFVVGGVR